MPGACAAENEWRPVAFRQAAGDLADRADGSVPQRVQTRRVFPVSPTIGTRGTGLPPVFLALVT